MQFVCTVFVPETRNKILSPVAAETIFYLLFLVQTQYKETMQTVLQHENMYTSVNNPPEHTGSWHGDLGRLTAAPDTCLNEDLDTKIWTQTISRQVNSRPADGHSWSLIFSRHLESWEWCRALYRITGSFKSSARTGVIIIRLCLCSPASRTLVSASSQAL